MRKRLRQIELSWVALLLVACTLGPACHRASSVNTNAPPAPVQQYQRIISLSPSTTEMLWGLGLFPRIVAVTDYDDFPPEVKQLPRVGGWSNTNLEQITSLRPDLIVMTESQAPLIKDKLDALGVKTLAVPSYTIADALAGIEQIGRATGHDAEAQKLVAETRTKLADVRARTKDAPRVRVLCIVDRVPGTLRGLYAASTGSFFAELIDIAGGQSIAPDAPRGFGQISKEAIVALDPEIILDLTQGGAQGGQLAEDPQAVWRELPQVKAVRTSRVYAVRDTSILHPSQFVGDSARKFAALLHPEIFKPQ